jgi:hypothetical protein
LKSLALDAALDVPVHAVEQAGSDAAGMRKIYG